jgi:hypothetical protein
MRSADADDAEAARSGFQGKRNEIQAGRDKIQARRNKIQVQRNEIQMPHPSANRGFSMGYRRLQRAWALIDSAEQPPDWKGRAARVHRPTLLSKKLNHRLGQVARKCPP